MGDYDIVVDPCQEKNWTQLHMDASRILTNRCHSAILGAILGKDTTMFKGHYHKNRSIYEYSLKKLGVNGLEAKDSYTDTTWHSKIKSSLDGRLPIFYGGTGSGGHAFV